MNIIYEDPSTPLRVLIANPLKETGWMLIQKIVRGVLFGLRQLVDVTLLVFSNEIKQAQMLTHALDCGMPCRNSMTISTEIPRLTDADIFIFISNFKSLNTFDYSSDDAFSFESLYLFMKIAPNLKYSEWKSRPKDSKITRKPIIICDGLVSLDIFKTFSDLPNDMLFCPSSVSGVAKSILGDHLKVNCNLINYFYAWGANEEVFHVDVQAPVYLHEHSHKRKKCQWSHMANLEYRLLGIDFTQFNASWLRKDFKEKIASILSFHPYRYLYKTAKMSRLLQSVWRTRSMKPVPKYHDNIGVISDGSLGTIEGLPYFLPVIFYGDTIEINEFSKDDYHFKLEIKKINEAALKQHKKLVNFCKMFYRKNILDLEFLPPESGTTLSFDHGLGEKAEVKSLGSASDDFIMPFFSMFRD